MTLTEQSLVAGHASFHNKCRPALSNKREADKATLGDRPVPASELTTTTQEEQAMAAWDVKQARINKATSVMKNARRMEANDFYAQVLSELMNTNAISLTGVTDQTVAAKVATITDAQIETAVLAVYNRF